MRLLSLAAALMLMLSTTPATTTPAHASEQEFVRVTFYNIRGKMRWGDYTHLGAAACGSYFQPGSLLQFNDDGWVVECDDTGLLAPAQIDVWAPSYAWGIENVEKAYGTYTWVTVLRLGWGDD